jgi:hypothetical protein
LGERRKKRNFRNITAWIDRDEPRRATAMTGRFGPGRLLAGISTSGMIAGVPASLVAALQFLLSDSLIDGVVRGLITAVAISSELTFER